MIIRAGTSLATLAIVASFAACANTQMGASQKTEFKVR
jgi:hypothetical protein